MTGPFTPPFQTGKMGVQILWSFLRRDSHSSRPTISTYILCLLRALLVRFCQTSRVCRHVYITTIRSFWSCFGRIGVGQQCCEIAKGAFRNGTLLVRPNNYVCGQSYNENSGPAPDLAVPLSWCQDHCPGYAISPANDTNVWATPLIQYILPAVIFSDHTKTAGTQTT